MDGAVRNHKIEWTDEKIKRLWDYYASSNQAKYFSALKGDDLIRICRKYIEIKGDVLDYGAGIGSLLAKLSSLKGVELYGCDIAQESINEQKRLLGNKKNYKGSLLVKGFPTDFKEKTFDTIFLVETIEHLLDEDLHNILNEVSRILKTGGNIIVTTPNDEDMIANEVICPDCGCIFHRKQHLRKWDIASLCSFMEMEGFKTKKCFEYRLSQSSSWNKILNKARDITKQKKPNLIYIGEIQ